MSEHLPCNVLPEGPPIPEPVSLQAVEWLIALQADEVAPEVRTGWQQWRSAAPDHERAWQHIEAFAAQVRELPARLAGDTLVRSNTAQVQSRRQAMKLLAVALFAGTGTWQVRDSQVWRVRQADYRTATGEQRRLVLADGSQVILNTGAAISVRFDGQQRLLELIDGEILITTAPDPIMQQGGEARPFRVATTEGLLRAIGTRFSVRQSAAGSHVTVFDGAVEVRPTATEAFVLAAGSQVRFTRSRVEPVMAMGPADDAWHQGMLVAHDMPLPDFLATLGRYRSGYLGCESGAAAVRVSGIYPVTDTERVLDMLERTLPVEVQRFTRYWVVVRPRLKNAS